MDIVNIRLLPLLFFCSSAALADPIATDMERFIPEAMAQYHTPGVAVAVVRNGQLVLLEGFGVRDVDTGAAVDADTVFQLASNSKPFTAATVGLAVQAGLAGWNTPVSQVDPAFGLFDPYASYWATPVDLLAHRSGLPAFRGDLLGDLGYSRAEVERRLRLLEPDHSFRSASAYSNANFFLAGEMVAHLYGQSWENVLRGQILDPLGMSRTGFTPELAAMDNVAAGHVRWDGQTSVTPVYDSAVFAAAGGMVSSARDMARWVQLLLDKGATPGGRQILSADTVDTLFEPAMVGKIDFSETPPIDTDTGFFYSPGWGIYYYKGQKVVEKGGSLPGVRTLVTLIPGQNTGIVTLTNLNLTLLPEALRAELLELAVGPSGRDLQKEILARQPAIDQMTAPLPPPDVYVPLAGNLADYAGVYANDLYGDFALTAENGVLRVEAGPGRYPGSLSHYSAETFVLRWDRNPTAGQFVQFARADNGQGRAFDTDTLGRFQRLAPSRPGFRIAEASGNAGDYTLAAGIDVAPADAGKSGAWYAMLQQGSELWFLHGAAGWERWQGGPFPAAAQGVLASGVLPLFTHADVSAWSGATVWVGYGSDETALLAGRYAVIQTLP